MVDTSIKILTNTRYYFKLRLKTAEAAYKIQEEEENEILSDYLKCFKCFNVSDVSHK